MPLNLKKRSHKKEQLDNLELSGNSLHETLKSLKWINSLFGNHRQLGNAVLSYAKNNGNGRPITIVDLGCGGGDCILAIAKKLEKNTISATYIGIDGNAQSIAHAKAHNLRPEHIQYITADILNEGFKLPACDLVISSHFMYHFKDDLLVSFLKKIASEGKRMFFFSELYRSRLAYYLFKISHLILPISNMAKRDGLLAIQRAFTIQEMQTILEQSALKQYAVKKKPWFRMLVQAESA
ncbi:methyltransferase domain-containing protein [Spongiimicrobium salis]|uniref:methyltransferase domain-containing protein n=1 Tax=Spongiimicrobium salis TaxID=1667022 RepID=UPI00374CD8B3